MGRIAAYGMNLSLNVIASPVQISMAAAPTIGLDGPARGALGLQSTGKKVFAVGRAAWSLVSGDQTATAHSAPSDDDDRTSGFCQVVGYGQIRQVAVDAKQLCICHWVASLLHALLHLVFPEGIGGEVGLSESAGRAKPQGVLTSR